MKLIGKRKKNKSLRIEILFYKVIVAAFVGYFISCSYLKNILELTCNLGKLNFEKPIEKITGRSLPNVYIGVLSAEKLLNDRLLSAAGTWMKSKNIFVEVIAANNQTIPLDVVERLKSSGITIVSLPGVDDNAYPPQKKSFALLLHMYDVHVNNFDWFVRIDDDAYMNFENLNKFLNSLNSSEALQVGHPGFGKDAGDKLQIGENYCMGGTGLILSRGILLKIRNGLLSCLENLITEHEDIEIGRCINKLTGIQCTLAWEVRNYFYQNYKDGTYSRRIETISKNLLTKGIIFHANKDKEYQFKLRVEVLKNKIENLIEKISKIEEDTEGYKDQIIEEYISQNSVLPLKWSAIQYPFHFSASTQQTMRIQQPLNEVLQQNFQLFTFKKPILHQSNLKSNHLLFTNYVVNPIRSIDAITTTEALYDVSKSSEAERKRFSFYQRQKFVKNSVFFHENTDLMTTPTSSGEKTTVNFIVSLSGRSDNFLRFILNFENTFLTRDEKVNLLVSYFPGPTEERPQNGPESSCGFICDVITQLQSHYPGHKLEVLKMEADKEFSRGAGMQFAGEYVKNAEEILFFCDVDLVFAPGILENIRRNTIRGSRAYYPVFLSQYDPEIIYAGRKNLQNPFLFQELDGFWRHFSYGMVSIYKEDFDRTSGFDLSLRGWGLEDIHFANAIFASGLDTFKSNDRNQVHIYHTKTCDASVLQHKQLLDCRKSKAAHFGPKSLLYYLWSSSSSNEFKV